MKESFLKTDLGQKLFEHLESFVLEMVYVTKSFQKRKEKKKKKEKEKDTIFASKRNKQASTLRMQKKS